MVDGQEWDRLVGASVVPFQRELLVENLDGNPAVVDDANLHRCEARGQVGGNAVPVVALSRHPHPGLLVGRSLRGTRYGVSGCGGQHPCLGARGCGQGDERRRQKT